MRVRGHRSAIALLPAIAPVKAHALDVERQCGLIIEPMVVLRQLHLARRRVGTLALHVRDPALLCHSGAAHRGKDEHGRVVGRFRASGLSPGFMDRVRDHGLDGRLRTALGSRVDATGGEGRERKGKERDRKS